MVRQSLEHKGGGARIPNSASLGFTGAGTIMMMMYLQQTSSSFRIAFSKGSDTNGAGWGAYVGVGSSNELSCANVWGGGQYNISAPANSIPLNKWVHLAFSWSSTSRKVYVDGVLLNTAGGAGTLRHANDSFIGGHVSGAGLSGFMTDEISIWNKQLSDDEVASLSHMPITNTSDVNLVGYWTINDDSGNQIKDATGKNNANLFGTYSLSSNESLIWSKMLFKDGLDIKSYALKDAVYSNDIVPVMTSDTAPSGTVSASTVYSDGTGTCSPFKVFDDTNTGSYDEWAATTNTGWLEYAFATSKVISRYSITTPAVYSDSPNRAPKDFTLEAWDGLQWVVLDTRTGITGWSIAERREFTFSNSTAYTRYRINVTAVNGSAYLALGQMEMMELTSPAQNGWAVIGQAPATKAMFDTDGMLNLSLITNEAIQLLVSDSLELLAWVDDIPPTASSKLSNPSNTATVNGQINEFSINQATYYNRIQSIQKG